MDEHFRKSILSHTSGCVEVALIDGQVVIRDSKDRAGPMLRFTPREWRAFLLGARNDEFDLPAEAMPR